MLLAAEIAGRPAQRVLITGAHAGALRFAARGLTRAGYTVETATTQNEAGARAALRPPDALILEVDLPDGSGVELCREIRSWSDAAILLTARSPNENAIVVGLDAGADDFVTTPVGLDELCARVRAAIRRVAGAFDEIVTVNDLMIDLSRRSVIRAGKRVRVTPTQLKILCLLARHPGKLLTHDEICQAVWGPRHFRSPNLLHVHIWQLRQRIEPDPTHPVYLLTEHGSGIRLADHPTGSGATSSSARTGHSNARHPAESANPQDKAKAA
jgi:two-component system, OmpR family, KDP operon response regulator KdpE